jgi:hypothetical protein
LSSFFSLLPTVCISVVAELKYLKFQATTKL